MAVVTVTHCSRLSPEIYHSDFHKYMLKSSTVIIMNSGLVGVKITLVVLFYYNRILQILTKYCLSIVLK